MNREDFYYRNSKDTNNYYQGNQQSGNYQWSPYGNQRNDNYQSSNYGNQQDSNYQLSAYGDQYEGTYVVGDEDLRRLDAVQTITARAFVVMFVALLATGVSAYLALETGLMYLLINSRGYWVLLLAEIAVGFTGGYALRRNMVVSSAILFITYSIANGVTLSIFAFTHKMGSIYHIFILTAVIYGFMAIYGLVTKRDLTSLGSLGSMGLVGAIIMTVFDVYFIQSGGMSMIISVVVLAIFIGLTAYHAQRIKKMAANNTTMSMNTIAMIGALILYLDFISIFMHCILLFGKKR